MITSHAHHLHIRRFSPIVVPSAVVLTRQRVPRGVKRQRPTSLPSHRRAAAAAAVDDDDDDVTIIADYRIISTSADTHSYHKTFSSSTVTNYSENTCSIHFVLR